MKSDTQEMKPLKDQLASKIDPKAKTRKKKSDNTENGRKKKSSSGMRKMKGHYNRGGRTREMKSVKITRKGTSGYNRSEKRIKSNYVPDVTKARDYKEYVRLVHPNMNGPNENPPKKPRNGNTRNNRRGRTMKDSKSMS